jgi:hypothetical protein
MLLRGNSSMNQNFTLGQQKKLRFQYFSAGNREGKLRFAQTCLHLTRRGYCLGDFFEREGLDGVYQELLDEALELHNQHKSGHLYLAVNPIYATSLYKIGATRKAPEERMRTLKTAGIPSQFTLVKAWPVPDVFAAEAHCRRALAERWVQREFYEGAYSELIEVLQRIVEDERDLVRKLSRAIELPSP